MTTYAEWRDMWDKSGPWRPTVDDIAVLLTEIDRHTHPDPGEHPNFRDTAEWLTVPGRTFSLDGVIYEVREVEDEDGGHPADTEPTAEAVLERIAATFDGAIFSTFSDEGDGLRLVLDEEGPHAAVEAVRRALLDGPAADPASGAPTEDGDQ